MRSMIGMAALVASVAAALSLAWTAVITFLMEERNSERWLILCCRRFSPCRARFFAEAMSPNLELPMVSKGASLC